MGKFLQHRDKKKSDHINYGSRCEETKIDLFLILHIFRVSKGPYTFPCKDEHSLGRRSYEKCWISHPYDYVRM